MVTFVRVLGLVMAVAGGSFVLAPEFLRMSIEGISRGRRIYLAPAIRLALGVLLVYAAPYCAWSGVVKLVGALALVSAVILLLIGERRMHALFELWTAGPAALLRATGVFAILLGLLLFGAA